MVAPASRRVLRARRYSRSGSTASAALSPTGLSPAPAARSSGLRPARHPSARALPRPPTRSSNPGAASPAGCAAAPVWAPPRSLAATRGILSFPPGTEMFQFPRCPPARAGARPSAGRVAPFGHPQIAGRQRLPGAFRRVAASFVGRQRLGIHHAPILAASPQSSVRPPLPLGIRSQQQRGPCTTHEQTLASLKWLVFEHLVIACPPNGRKQSPTQSQDYG